MTPSYRAGRRATRRFAMLATEVPLSMACSTTNTRGASIGAQVAPGLLLALLTAFSPTAGSIEIGEHARTLRIQTRRGDVLGETAGLPALSADCRMLAFSLRERVHVLDRETGEDTVASLSQRGEEASAFLPSISADGRFVGFASRARNLVAEGVSGYVRDLRAAGTWRLPGSSGAPVVSAHGTIAIYASRPLPAQRQRPGRDAGPPSQLRAFDLRAGGTELVSVSSKGVPGDADSMEPTTSWDARVVAFASEASNLIPDDRNRARDIFVRDRAERTTLRASRGIGGADADGHSDFPSLDASGRYVVFTSEATNLIEADTNEVADVFLHDRRTRRTQRLSLGPGNAEANGGSDFPALSADGRRVAFVSRASNLVPGDTNDAPDVFLHDRPSGRTVRVSVATDGTQGDDESGNFGTRISADGRCIGFESYATTLVPGDRNRRVDFFLHEVGDPSGHPAFEVLRR